MQAEALLWEFHKANLRNNGYGGGIITIVGDPDAPIDVNTRGEVTLTAREAFEAQLQQNTLGAENAGAFTVLWLTGTNPVLPKIEPFANSTENDTRFLNLAPVIKEAITTAWGVPSILANIQEAGKLGNTQEIELAIMRMNDVVKPFQAKLEYCLNTLLHLIYPLQQVEIIPTSPILEIPQWIFDNLSQEAKNEYIENKYGIKNNLQNVTTNTAN
jgi:capsid portal protein